MSPHTQLVFSGELMAGYAPDEVRRSMAEHFKLSEQQLDQMFSGKEVVLKRHLDDREALRYVKHLSSLGVHVQARPMPDAAPTTTAALLSTSMPLAPPSSTGKAWDPYQPDTIPVEPMVPLRPTPRPVAAKAPAMPEPDTLPVTEPSPLTLAEAIGGEAPEVRCPTCGEQQPMRVLCRQCATNLEMALRARSEDDARLKAERLDATRARRGPPPAGHGASGFGSTGHAASRTFGDEPSVIEAAPLWGWGWEGRIGRVSFATGVFVLSLVMVLASLITSRMPATIGATLNFLILVPTLVMQFRQSALRLHDREHSGWWNLVVALPFAAAIVAMLSPALGFMLFGVAVLMGLMIGIYLLFFPGHEGDNAYGEVPHEGNVPLLVASIVLFFVVGSIAPEPKFVRDVTSTRTTAGKVASNLKSVEAQRAYVGEYLVAGRHKAFAASPDGSWGWKSEVGSVDTAMSEALATCEQHRTAAQRPCELVSIDGKAVP